MRMTQPNEFVLVKDPTSGKHFEEFCDAGAIPADIVNRAKAGTLGGHTPQPGWRYAFRGYFYKERTLIKLTHRRIKSIRR